MARPATLKLGLLLALVLVVPTMYTRLLQQEAPKPVAEAPPPPPPKRRSIAAVRSAAAASAPVAPVKPPEKPAEPDPQPVAAAPSPPTEVPSGPEIAPGETLALAGQEPPGPAAPASSAAPPTTSASAPQSPASAPIAAAQVPASAPATDPLAAWPTDTQLSYRLGGRFRSGELYGDARVAWQRKGGDYQVRVDIEVTLWATLIMTSQGQVTPEGLMPRAYEEIRPGRKKTRSAKFGDTVLALENGKTAPRPEGMQDTASQFVELSHRFASGREKLEVGRTVDLWLARPGAVDRWTYEIVEREMLQTPNLGAVEAFRLKPRPIANPRGNITAEMWFAPSLQYLPVRIKVMMGSEAEVDLLVDKIEQR